MSPERRRWLRLITWADLSLAAIGEKALQRMGQHDAIVLTSAEQRDIGILIALCEHAEGVCARIGSSLADDD